MREIKFRVWNKNEHTMNIVTMLLFATQELDYLGNNNEPYSWDHFEIMEYTNKKDINGKEIYEGDICKDYEGDLYPIEYDEEWCGFSWDAMVISERELEVVGNIYEDFHLLNKVKYNE
jgi:uncharacterized phage protein (TIGR01671 family)